MIILSYKKLKTFLDNKCPLATQVEPRKCWEESNEIACCYMLASMTNTFYKQLESCKTAKVILDKLEDMLRCQVVLAKRLAITSLMNDQQKPGTPIKDHMITLMGYFSKAANNEANLD
ncbi:hypothetical protein J1N35_042894 [Gossypium stocksii]|uniref:Uncharacterized protein n=1 Tax=Gossypium stocksii TaxID=47602 RepID=A0A9D3U6E9_9ROSI|nr:hypothetical protein J1N35_042894 [Gossypium stocksii]